MDLTQQLSTNFCLAEMVITEHREFLEQNQNPIDLTVNNLKALCANILQPLRNACGYALHINSGYRCTDLNKAVGGAVNSQHITGNAADVIDYTNGNLYLFNKIKDSDLPFDQLITECPDANGVPAWVHVSFDQARNRKQILKAKIVGTNPNGSPIFEYGNF